MKYLLTISLFTLSFLLPAQPDLIPFRKGNLWGFCDKNKKIIVPCQYENAFQFAEGRAMVQLNKKVGFMDESGKVVIPIQYDYLLDSHFFKNGLTKVRLGSGEGNNIGLIDKNGKIILPFEYYLVGDFSEGLLRVGKLIENKIKFGFCDINGLIIIPLEYENAGMYVKEGKINVRLKQKFGFIDKENKWLIDPKYPLLSEYRNGMAVFAQENQYIDKAGNSKTELKFGFINHLGEEIIPARYNQAMPFQEGFAYVREDNFSRNTSYLIDKQGISIHKKGYEAMNYFVSEGLIWVKQNGKFGFMDTLGREAIPLVYEDAQAFQQGMALVRQKGKYGFINAQNQAVTSFKYDLPSGKEVGKFHEGLAAVYQQNADNQGKWGFIDTKGKEVIACKYDEITPFFKGLARVYLRNGDNWHSGYIDKNGAEYWEE